MRFFFPFIFFKLYLKSPRFGYGLPLEFIAVSYHFLPRVWLTNATIFIITSVQNNIDPGEYSSGLWKCRCPLGAVRCRPSLLRQLAKMIYKYSHAWLSRNEVKCFGSANIMCKIQTKNLLIFWLSYKTHNLANIFYIRIKMVTSFWLRSDRRKMSHHSNHSDIKTSQCWKICNFLFEEVSLMPSTLVSWQSVLPYTKMKLVVLKRLFRKEE